MRLKVLIISALLANAGCLQDVSILDLSNDPDVQVEQVLEFIQLSKSERNLTSLYDSLRQTLEPVWPGFGIVPFGSRASGLDIKSSDLDLLIIVQNTNTDAEDKAKRAYNLFQQRPDIYRNLELKLGKRLPIVTFDHISGWHSDLTFSGLPSIQNSEVIGYLLNIDQRAANLAKLVKYWSKLHNLNGSVMLSTYCHYLQVIFFLQIKQILPVIIDLQKGVTNIFNNYNVAFNRKEYTTRNNETLYQLLGGYFKFYSVFNYDNFVISTFLGRMLEKKDFESLERVTNDLELYKHNVLNGISQPYPLDRRLISIQDPFDHNINSARSNLEKTEKVISHFKYAAKMFVEDKDNSFLRSILTKHADYEI